MSEKKNLRITIDKESIPEKPLDPIPHKSIEVPDELEYVEKVKKKDINLNFRDGLRLVERFINKWLGYLIGNNESPVPSLPTLKLSWGYIIIIVVLIILLWIK